MGKAVKNRGGRMHRATETKMLWEWKSRGVGFVTRDHSDVGKGNREPTLVFAYEEM